METSNTAASQDHSPRFNQSNVSEECMFLLHFAYIDSFSYEAELFNEAPNNKAARYKAALLLLGDKDYEHTDELLRPFLLQIVVVENVFQG